MIHIYYGRGKGKTSAGIGAAVRAAGQGRHVLIVQFLKDAWADSGEVRALQKLSLRIELLRAELKYCVFRPPHQKAVDHLKSKTRSLFSDAVRKIRTGKYQMVVLDELGMALKKGWIGDAAVRELLDTLPDTCELIITGRYMPRWLLDRAHLVTQMRAVRHPHDKGIKARKGIEY